MADKYYNGHLLPDIETLWDKSKYPYACIAIMGNIAMVLFTDKVGYIDRETVSGYTIGSYTLGLTSNDAYDESKVIFARVYVVALNEAGVEQWADTYPGINTDAWVEKAWSDPMGTGIPTYGYYAISVQDGPQWSNHTLYDQNGNLVIEPSDPVAYFDLRAWLTGYALGLCGKPLPFAQKEPVAYLYNGVRLPALPEWDRGKHPYAVIRGVGTSDTISYYQLFICNKYNVYVSDTGSICFGEDSGGGIGVTFMVSTCASTNGTWSDFDEYNSSQIVIDGSGGLFKPASWSNVDISLDGTTYLTASEPVPVYE